MVTVDLENVKERAKKLELLETIFTGIQKRNRDAESLNSKIKELNSRISLGETMYKDTLKEAGTCPLCKQSTCKEHV